MNNYERTMLVNSRDSTEEADVKNLSREVQIKIIEKYMKQYNLRNVFKSKILSESKFNSLHTYKLIYAVRQHNFDKSWSVSKKDPVPRYARTRHVTIQMFEWKGQLCIIVTCDCGYMYRERHMCRHAHCVLNEKPCLDHFHPKCYKSYFNFMHRNVEYTNMIDEYDDLFRLKKGLIFNVNKYNGYVKIIYSCLSVLFILTLNHVFKDFYHHLVCIPRTLMKIGS